MGTIFAIKRYALHDGPNIRTTVFFKGCPLSCWWCHNPEGIEAHSRLIWDQGRCIGCRTCVEQCVHGGLMAAAEGLDWREEDCGGCGSCVDHCPALALEWTGRAVSAAEVMATIVQDIPFFDRSGGGVTFSGGEPLQQPDFLHELLVACGRLGLHRTVDTSGYAPRKVLMDLLEEIDLFLYDLKLLDRDRHRLYTGVSNRVILDNLHLLVERNCAVQIRLPLIPGINDDSANLVATAALLTELGLTSLDLLPFHRSAAAKYRKLHLPYKGTDLTPGPPQAVDQAKQILEDSGLSVRIGG